jgi:prevent-host-death family protein
MREGVPGSQVYSIEALAASMEQMTEQRSLAFPASDVKVKHQVQYYSGAYGTMERVSMLEFRRDAEAVIRKVRRGQRLIMTYRGKPVMRLEPIQTSVPRPDDPFYQLAHLATHHTARVKTLTNEEIDQIIYAS